MLHDIAFHCMFTFKFNLFISYNIAFLSFRKQEKTNKFLFQVKKSIKESKLK